MNDNAVYDSIIRCISVLRNPAQDSKSIEKVTEELQRLEREFTTVEAILKAYDKFEDDCMMRLHLIIYLKKIVTNNFVKYNESNQEIIFKGLIDRIMTEITWLNRHNLIDVLFRCNIVKHRDIIWKFLMNIKERIHEPEIVELFLIFSSQLNHEFVGDSYVQSFIELCTNVIGVAVKNLLPEVTQSILQFFAMQDVFDISNLLLEYPFLWGKFLDLFDIYIDDKRQFAKLVNLFKHSILERKFFSVEQCHHLSLLEKVLSILSRPDISYGVISSLCTVIYSLCSIYRDEIIGSQLLDPLITILYKLPQHFFNLKDGYDISQATFFVDIIQELLCESFVEILWNNYAHNVNDDYGLFYFLCFLLAVLRSKPTLILNHSNDIIYICNVSLTRMYPLILDLSAQVIDEFASSFVVENDEISNKFIERIVQTLSIYPNYSLLHALSSLFDMMGNTDAYITAYMPLFFNLFEINKVKIRDGVLECFSVLVKWSTYTIFPYYERLLNLIITICNSDKFTVESLGMSAITCFACLFVRLQNYIQKYLPDFINFSSNCIKSETIVEKTLRAVCQVYDIFFEHLTTSGSMDIFIDFVLHHSSIDISDNYVSQLKTGDIDDFSVEPEQFGISAASLLLLTRLLYIPEKYGYLSDDIFKRIILQLKSYSNTCKVAAVKSLVIFTKAYPQRFMTEIKANGFLNILFPLLSHMGDATVQYHSLIACGNIISYLPCDQQVSSLFTSQIVKILSEPNLLIKKPEIKGEDIYESVLYVVKCIISTSGNNSYLILDILFPKFLNFIESESRRLQSLGFQFFAELIEFGENLDKDLKSMVFNKCFEKARYSNDGYLFSCLSSFYNYDKHLITPKKQEILSILYDKIICELPQSKQTRILKEYALSAVNSLRYTVEDIENIGVDFSVFVSHCLRVMPVQVVFSENKNILNLLFWFYENMNLLIQERSNYKQNKYEIYKNFMRVLVLQASHDKSVIIMYSKISEVQFKKMIRMAVEILEEFNTFDIKEFIDGNEVREEIFRYYVEEMWRLRHEEEENNASTGYYEIDEEDEYEEEELDLKFKDVDYFESYIARKKKENRLAPLYNLVPKSNNFQINKINVNEPNNAMFVDSKGRIVKGCTYIMDPNRRGFLMPDGSILSCPDFDPSINVPDFVDQNGNYIYARGINLTENGGFFLNKEGRLQDYMIPAVVTDNFVDTEGTKSRRERQKLVEQSMILMRARSSTFHSLKDQMNKSGKHNLE